MNVRSVEPTVRVVLTFLERVHHVLQTKSKINLIHNLAHRVYTQ